MLTPIALDMEVSQTSLMIDAVISVTSCYPHASTVMENLNGGISPWSVRTVSVGIWTDLHAMLVSYVGHPDYDKPGFSDVISWKMNLSTGHNKSLVLNYEVSNIISWN